MNGDEMVRDFMNGICGQKTQMEYLHPDKMLEWTPKD